MAMLREIYAEWGRGDYTRTDFLHPEFELEFGSDFLDGGLFKGFEAVSAGWRVWLKEWSFWRSPAREYIELGDRILVLIDAEGVAKSSGIELAQPSANVWEFRDGKPFHLTLYTHEETALRELGQPSS